MSDPLRVAAAVEGPTDKIVLQAIIHALLPTTDFEFHTLQPEGSVAFQPPNIAGTGAGWAGVYRWCRQSAAEGGGSVSGSSALFNHDVLIVQVDADVANKTYGSGNIQNATHDDLPCEAPCPPVNATTNALRAVILNWLGDDECHPRVFYAHHPRIWRPGCSPHSARTMVWFHVRIGSVARVPKINWELCLCGTGSENARTTI